MTSLDLFKPSQEMREFNLLQELEKNPVISQRELSHKFGIALGVTNACLKRMALRGWIRISSLNHRRIGYYLTPQGFAEKTKLSLHLISWTVRHYVSLKESIAGRFLDMQRAGVKRVVFYGMSDEMEIAYITLQGVDLELVGIIEDDYKIKQKQVFGFQIKNITDVMIMNPDAVLITALTDVEEKTRRLKEVIGMQEVRVWNISNP